MTAKAARDATIEDQLRNADAVVDEFSDDGDAVRDTDQVVRTAYRLHVATETTGGQRRLDAEVELPAYENLSESRLDEMIDEVAFDEFAGEDLSRSRKKAIIGNASVTTAVDPRFDAYGDDGEQVTIAVRPPATGVRNRIIRHKAKQVTGDIPDSEPIRVALPPSTDVPPDSRDSRRASRDSIDRLTASSEGVEPLYENW